jgi:hypothetical protein
VEASASELRAPKHRSPYAFVVKIPLPAWRRRSEEWRRVKKLDTFRIGDWLEGTVRCPFPACFRVAGAQASTIQRREVPPLSLHLHYRDYCAIISRALISSRQGGYMVNAARASAARATAPPPFAIF